MEKAGITRLLEAKHTNLVQWLQSHPAEKWAHGPKGKWTTGQHIVHLIQSTKPLVRALSLPGFVLRWKFGKANRPSRDYDSVIARYQEKLAAIDGKIVSPFSKNMPDTPPESKAILLNELADLNQKLNKKMVGFSETQLDLLLLPHPLMGRMTLREILMWNAYHTEHHQKILEKMY